MITAIHILLSFISLVILISSTKNPALLGKANVATALTVTTGFIAAIQTQRFIRACIGLVFYGIIYGYLYKIALSEREQIT